MSTWRIKSSKLRGVLSIPPSKSHTMRALLFAAMGEGKSTLHNVLFSPDTFGMMEALRLLGAKITVIESSVEIWGTSGKVQTPSNVIECGNSGQVLRFVGALTSLQPHYALLTGDESIRTHRSIQPLIEGLQQWGAFASSSRQNGYAPLIVRGPLVESKEAIVQGEDSQPISGLLMAAAFAPFPLSLNALSCGEKPWIELTLHWFDRMGIPYKNEKFSRYSLLGATRYKGFELSIPGDYSSAAFPLVAALLTHSSLVIKGLCPKDPQGDKVFIAILVELGAKIEWHGTDLHVEPSSPLRGGSIDANDCIDAVPILAVLGCFGTSPLEILNIQIARSKESDRLTAITSELKKMGGRVEERSNSLLIFPSPLRASDSLFSHKDHRIALALCVAAFAATENSCLKDVDCIQKSYPSFYEDFVSIGARILKKS